jgi:hypothetical protein
MCAMTQNFVVLRCDLDRIRPNIRNDSETSLATWQWRAKVPLTCLCGHYPIVELCTITNQTTGLSVNRVEKDRWRALNAETIDHAHTNPARLRFAIEQAQGHC